MRISQYIVVAVVRCSRACSRLPVRRSSWRVVSGHGYGMLGDLVVGVVGAFLGGWLFAVVFGVVGGGFIVSLLTAFVGAVILLWVIRLVAPGRA